MGCRFFTGEMLFLGGEREIFLFLFLLWASVKGSLGWLGKEGG